MSCVLCGFCRCEPEEIPLRQSVNKERQFRVRDRICRKSDVPVITIRQKVGLNEISYTSEEVFLRIAQINEGDRDADECSCLTSK